MSNRKKWSKRISCAALFVGILAAAGMVYASSGQGGSLSHEKLMDLLWRTLNFAALVIILVKFLAKPIANGLRSRRMSIVEKFENLEGRRSEAENSYKGFEEKLARIEDEINEIISTAQDQAKLEKEKIIADAHRAAGDIKRQAEMAVQYELAAAKLLLRREVADQAVLIAEELIRKNLKKDDQVKLIEDYLDKVGTIQ